MTRQRNRTYNLVKQLTIKSYPLGMRLDLTLLHQQIKGNASCTVITEGRCVEQCLAISNKRSNLYTGSSIISKHRYSCSQPDKRWGKDEILLLQVQRRAGGQFNEKKCRAQISNFGINRGGDPVCALSFLLAITISSYEFKNKVKLKILVMPTESLCISQDDRKNNTGGSRYGAKQAYLPQSR